jgi:hypothetical protein
MDGRGNRVEDFGGSGEYIWLRYGTQVTANGRSYTIEMNIPMPIGASEEVRERLLREADAGMNQVANHVENRVAQLLQRGQSAPVKLPVPTPTARSVPQPRPASVSAPQTGPQPLQFAPPQENVPEPVVPAQPAVSVPTPRLNIAASMPSTPALGESSNLSLQQFIGYIRENMGLNPKQAMDLLKIKTLSGVNLRDAVEQLQKLVGHESTTTTQAEQRVSETVPTAASPARQNSGSLSGMSSISPNTGRGRTVGEAEPLYAFDEEEEPGENHEDDLEDLDFPRELTAQERVQARSKLDSLRESRGPTQSNQARQQALMNVVDSQISMEQLQDLMAGVWNVTSVKKLKVDQVEVLISWAKEDDFVSEVEAVLAMLEEE